MEIIGKGSEKTELCNAEFDVTNDNEENFKIIEDSDGTWLF
jgi:hypothetical protein